MLFPNDLTDDSDTGVLFSTILSRKSRETQLSLMTQLLITVILVAICLYVGKRIADNRKLNEKKPENIVNCTPPPPYRGEPFPKMKENEVNASFLNRLKNLDAISCIIIATFLIACFMPFASFEKGWYLKTVTCFTSLFYEESSLFGIYLLSLPIIALFINQ